MTYTTDDLDLILTSELERSISDGYPPRNVSAWRDACRRDMLDNEKVYPGYIAKAANGIRARREGRRITGWRETRGTHGIDYTPDPKGTDRPPWI